MAGHAHRGTGGRTSSSGCCAMTPKAEFRGWGIGVKTRCATGSGRAMRCVVIGPDIRGTAQVVNLDRRCLPRT